MKVRTLIPGILALMIISAKAQILYTTGTYSQNFDNLFVSVPANNTTVTTATTLPSGWSVVESLANANTSSRVDNGSSGTGDSYLYGATNSNERALGGYASGSMSVIFGAQIVNNNAFTLTQFTLTFDGEQWKDGGSATAVFNTDTFSYGIGNTDLTTGSFTNNTSLNFTAVVNNNTADVATDGNNASFRTAGITATVSGISWAPGQSLWIRWTDLNETGNDDGLAVDNVQFQAVPEPSTYTMILAAIGLVCLVARQKIRRAQA